MCPVKASQPQGCAWSSLIQLPVFRSIQWRILFGGAGGNRTRVRNTFSYEFTTINPLEVQALLVPSVAVAH